MRRNIRNAITAGLVGVAAAAAQSSVLTYHNDNARTGQYPGEILLSPANVSAGLFGKRLVWTVDGAVYAQPLYLARVKIAGKGFHNVVFVATSHDSLYAFDADDQSALPLWQVSFLNANLGATTVSAAEVNCEAMGELGISGTPVIDSESGTIYVIAYTRESGNQYVYRLHALDVTSGAERAGSPVEIQPAGFVALEHKQRAALLVANGTVYSSWSGNCDHGTYHGWLMAHDEATLDLLEFFNSSPGDTGASFWNGGAGPAADAQGNIYVVSANGDFDGDFSLARYDESVLRFSAEPGLLPADQFTPFNKLALDAADLDLGSSGAVLLPAETGTAEHPYPLFTSGKEGRMYLLDSQALGGVQEGADSGALASLPVLGAQTFGSAAYFNGSIYVAPKNSPLFAFGVAGAGLSASPSASTASVTGSHGATPSVSSNGTENGIAWVLTEQDGGRLLAFDAGNLRQLYDSSAVASDQAPAYAEFTEPTIADGKVFAGGEGSVAIYGEISQNAPEIAGLTNAASYSTTAISPGSLISIFGSGLAAITASAAPVPLPVSLADTSVTVNGVPAPILFESPAQINAQVPWEVAAGTANVVVRSRGAVSQAMQIIVQAAAPGLFTNGMSAAALNADGSVNSEASPATVGSVISVYFTGQGPVNAAIDDGAAPDNGQIVSATSSMSARIGGTPAQIEFAGLAPLYPGLGQMNVKIPALGSGVYPLIITIGGQASNSAEISIAGMQ